MDEVFIKTKKRYITCGIQAELDQRLIQYLWDLIEEERKYVKLDYLQVMNLRKEVEADGKTVRQRIEHSQEEPPYQRIYYIPVVSNVVECNIFVIDEPDHSSMLFAREY